jgi:hypothetical protein
MLSSAPLTPSFYFFSTLRDAVHVEVPEDVAPRIFQLIAANSALHRQIRAFDIFAPLGSVFNRINSELGRASRTPLTPEKFGQIVFPSGSKEVWRRKSSRSEAAVLQDRRASLDSQDSQDSEGGDNDQRAATADFSEEASPQAVHSSNFFRIADAVSNPQQIAVRTSSPLAACGCAAAPAVACFLAPSTHSHCDTASASLSVLGSLFYDCS